MNSGLPNVEIRLSVINCHNQRVAIKIDFEVDIGGGGISSSVASS
jgi:hypothetical protein